MKNNKLIYIIMAVIIILIIVVVGLAIGIPFIKDNSKDNSSSSKESSVHEEEKENNEENTEDNAETKIMLSWVGTYTNEDIEVVINPISSDTLNMFVSEKSSNGGAYRSVGIYEMTEDRLLGKKYYDSDAEINIEKNKNGISIECKKLEEDDDFDYSGDYEKEKLNSTKWTGIYQKDDITIILSKTDEDDIDYIIEKNSKRSSMSTNGSIEYDSEKILEKEDDFPDEYTIKFEKKGDSIVVKATSEDEDSFLNEIDGTYEKIY